MKKLNIYTDGASKGNPGDSAIGVVITDDNGNLIKEIGEYIGVATNNVAEYSALIRALEESLAIGAETLEICTDSELLARQISGAYKVKSDRLKPLFLNTIELLKKFKKVNISHVMREFNTRADELANIGVKNKNKPFITNVVTTDINLNVEQPDNQVEFDF